MKAQRILPFGIGFPSYTCRLLSSCPGQHCNSTENWQGRVPLSTLGITSRSIVLLHGRTSESLTCCRCSFLLFVAARPPNSEEAVAEFRPVVITMRHLRGAMFPIVDKPPWRASVGNIRDGQHVEDCQTSAPHPRVPRVHAAFQCRRPLPAHICNSHLGASRNCSRVIAYECQLAMVLVSRRRPHYAIPRLAATNCTARFHYWLVALAINQGKPSHLLWCIVRAAIQLRHVQRCSSRK